MSILLPTWDFFFTFANFNFYCCKKYHFLNKKNGKKIVCARPTAHNFGHPLNKKQTFLRLALGHTEASLSVTLTQFYND